MTDEDKIRVLELSFCNGESIYKNKDYQWYCNNFDNHAVEKNIDILSWLSWKYLVNIDVYTETHKHLLRKDKLRKINQK